MMTRSACALPLLTALLAGGPLGCGDKEDDPAGSGADTGGLPVSDTGICADAPVVTWENYGHGFVLERCQSCHASTSDNRYGAPEGVSFDTKEEALAQADRILARVVDDETMPPSGGVDADDLELVEIWLTCWE